jgi:fructuronate reductase
MQNAQSSMPRLHPDTLGCLSPEVKQPSYARTELKPGIVHIGIGAFMRGHLAAINETVIQTVQKPGAMDWGIVGVSLRQPDTRDALMPQDGLYTLAIRDADTTGHSRQALQVIGCVRNILVAPENPQKILEQVAHTDTRIVSLTITEKGYCHIPATGLLQFDHPDILHDLEHPGSPCTAIGFIVHGLHLRKQTSRGPLTLMSLDNLPSNGHLLKKLIIAFAEKVDAQLAKWIQEHCTFPCSMVDRIVPRTTPADQQSISASMGLNDAWPVIGEPFIDWAIEDDFACGRPDWNLGGARFVASAAAWETLKLRMVNGTHSCIAYLGSVAGWETVDVAITQPELHACVQALMQREIEPTLPVLPGLDIAQYRASLLERFANPALAHRTQQIAMDGSQKIPQRWLGTVTDQMYAKRDISWLALCLAAWLRYLQGQNELGQAYEINDPLAQTLKERLNVEPALYPDRQSCEQRALALCSFEPVFGSSSKMPDMRLVATIGHHLHLLNTLGVAQTIKLLLSPLAG